MPQTGRRNALKLLSGSFVVASFPWQLASANAQKAGNSAGDGTLALVFDGSMRTQVVFRGKALTPFQASESLLTAKGPIDSFVYKGHVPTLVDDPKHGRASRHSITGTSANGIEKTVDLTFFEQFPGLAVLQVHYRNTGTTPLEITGWRNGAHELADTPGGFWSFSGATHEDRRDWIQPVKAGFEQRNTLRMAASDYGGGIPMANLWSRDVGLAVGHLEPLPRLLDLPVSRTAKGARLAIESTDAATLAPGTTLSTDRTFIVVHTGDHFAPLTQYRRFLEQEGVAGPQAPESAFAPV